MDIQGLEGQLELFPPGEVVRLMVAAHATGRLDFVREREQTSIFFVDGRAVSARTTGVSVRVGEALVAAGIVHPEAVELMAAMQQDVPGQRLGRMLVDSGLLGEGDVRAALREVQRRILFGVLLWRDGGFRFQPGEQADPDDIGLDGSLDLEHLIAETTRVARAMGSERDAA